MNKRILLIQIRDPKDKMLEHEADCVRRKFQRLAVELVTVNAVEKQVEADLLKEVDGVVIGGSGDFSVHHPLSQVFVQPLFKTLEVLTQLSLPTFGICFGHQLIGAWLGSEVRTDPGRAELGTVRVQKTPASDECPMLHEFGTEFAVHSGHSDFVVETPLGTRVILSNEMVSTQGFLVEGAPIVSVQFHPDMTGAEARSRLLAYRDGFTDRIETDAASFAKKFELGADESTQLLHAFFKSHAFSLKSD
ncbi:MAG: glutamine amidotransferase-related protein [Bradymonadia bacterium]